MLIKMIHCRLLINCFVCLSINFDILSDISAWIKALGPRNHFELTGISSYAISSYPKLIWLLYEGKKSRPVEKLDLSGNSS